MQNILKEIEHITDDKTDTESENGIGRPSQLTQLSPSSIKKQKEILQFRNSVNSVKLEMLASEVAEDNF